MTSFLFFKKDSTYLQAVESVPGSFSWSSGQPMAELQLATRGWGAVRVVPPPCCPPPPRSTIPRNTTDTQVTPKQRKIRITVASLSVGGLFHHNLFSKKKNKTKQNHRNTQLLLLPIFSDFTSWREEFKTQQAGGKPG